MAVVMLVGTAFAGVPGALLALPVAAAGYLVLEEFFARRQRQQA